MNYYYLALAAILVLAGLAKLVGIEAVKKEFKHWNLPANSYYIVGTLEIITAILLYFPETQFASLLAACFIMTGAVIVLLIASNYWRTVVPLAVFTLAAYLMWTDFPDALMTKIGLAINGVLLLAATILWAYPATKMNEEGEVEQLDEDCEVSHHFRKVLGVRYHYVTSGDPKNHPVVIIPGLPETWYAWHHQIIALSKKHFVIALDMKPFGQTEGDLDGDHSYEQISAEVKALLDAIGVDKFHLMGHDRGTVTCDHLISKEGMTERVSKYVRMQQSFNEPHGEPVPPHHIMGTFLGTMVYKMRFAISAIYNSDYVTHKLDKKVIRRLTKEFQFKNIAQSVPLTFQTTSFGKELKDRQHWLFQYMTMPILILQGTGDPGQHVEEYYESHKVCPDLRVQFIEAGHFFQGEAPEETNKALLEFFNH